jgi:hypothetical protein
MDFAKFTFYFLTSLPIFVFCYVWLFPYLERKITWYYYSLMVKRISKRQDGETKKKLEEVSAFLKKLSDEEKL